MKRYFGKYRGTVSDNVDDPPMGRLRAFVPDVLGPNRCTWAMPCMPFGGNQNGFFAMPPRGAGVWIEFEGGDTRHPIWSGCYWAEKQLPPLATSGDATVQRVVIQTVGGNSLMISDSDGDDGGIQLTSAGGATISITGTTITISNGQGAKLEIKANKVTVNDGALEVM